MSDLIISLSQVMRAEVDSLNSIAQNSANVNTVGYKSIRSTSNATNFIHALTQNQISDSVVSKVNSTGGQVNVTDRALDFAIIGNGWFGVQHKDGLAFTRNGSFTVNENNVLTTHEGDPVLGVNGPITLPSESISVDSTGMISTSGGEQFKLAIYDIVDGAISPMGDGLYSATDFNLMENKIKILQRAVETSNVDAASDMVRMMETTRHIESMQRAINTYNELLNSGINQIGK